MWVVELNHISELEFGFLSAVEMATAMLVYIPVAYLADRSSKKPFRVDDLWFLHPLSPGASILA